MSSLRQFLPFRAGLSLISTALVFQSTAHANVCEIELMQLQVQCESNPEQIRKTQSLIKDSIRRVRIDAVVGLHGTTLLPLLIAIRDGGKWPLAKAGRLHNLEGGDRSTETLQAEIKTIAQNHGRDDLERELFIVATGRGKKFKNKEDAFNEAADYAHDRGSDGYNGIVIALKREACKDPDVVCAETSDSAEGSLVVYFSKKRPMTLDDIEAIIPIGTGDIRVLEELFATLKNL